MSNLDQLHEDGRELVAGIIKRKQEAEAWADWEAKQPKYRSPRPVSMWPDQVAATLRLDPRPDKRDKLEWIGP